MKDASYWTKQLKEQRISFPELVHEIEKRVREKNLKLNALVTFKPEEAIACSARLTNRTQSAFGGQPIPLKMLGQNNIGWSATSGSQLLSGFVSTHTDFFVRELEQNGFIPLGQTNAPEFGFKNVTDPKLYGPARNPWNLKYSPGGSSGGAAAAVAAGMYPIAGASDGGGSIRIPASFTGLIGLKPTRGTMPVGPKEWRGWQGASINFALTVSMRDTEKLFYKMRISQPEAPYQPPKSEWEHIQTDGQRKLKIAFTTESPIGSPISDDAIMAVRQTVSFLETKGYQLTEIHYPVDGIEMMNSYYVMNGGETAAMLDDLEQMMGHPVQKDQIELMSWAIYQYGKKLDAAKYVSSLQQWDSITKKMENLFKKYDLFLTPTTAYTAPRISQDLQSSKIRQQLNVIDELNTKQASNVIFKMFEKSLQLTPFTQVANLTGQPAISLPTYVGQDGLPLGVQFSASKGREDLLFQVGHLLEENHCFCLPNYYRS